MVRLVIGGEEFIAEPGTSWIHPRGVPHFSEALEDCDDIQNVYANFDVSDEVMAAID